MLDIKSNLILKILQRECKSGGYKIVNKTDIISALPNKYRCSLEELDQITNFLERQDYITIKYDDENVYCLCVLPFFIETDKKQERPNIWPFVFIFLLCILGSFIGALLTKFVI